MIIIELNNGDIMKLESNKYYAYTDRGWLRIREQEDSIPGKIKHIIPMTSIFSVSFD